MRTIILLVVVCIVSSIALSGCGMTKQNARNQLLESYRFDYKTTPYAFKLGKTGKHPNKYSLYVMPLKPVARKDLKKYHDIIVDFVTWLEENGHITYAGNSKFLDSQCRYDFDGMLTESGKDYFEETGCADPGPNWGSEPISYDFYFAYLSDYTVVSIQENDYSARVEFYPVFEWIEGDCGFVENLRNKMPDLSLEVTGNPLAASLKKD